MDIVFLGTPEFAKDILDGLSKNHNILAIITQPDKPRGRKKLISPSPVKQWALSNNKECYQPEKSAQIIQILDNIQAQRGRIQAVITVAYGKILKQEVINKYPCFNLHGSMLPYWRGATPVQTSIMNDYLHFGLSVIAMDEGLDSGDIAASHKIDKSEVKDKTIDLVFKYLAPYGIALLESVLTDLANNRLSPIAQDSKSATFCKKFDKNDAYLDFADSKSCYLRYLALSGLGVWTKFDDCAIKINRICAYEIDIKEPKGKILQIQGDKILIACDIGALWLDAVTMPNKPKMSAKSMIQSKGLKIGDILRIS